jgi:hypothetical protein
MSCFHSCCDSWQGGQDSNLQPTVLETATLPIELPPFGFAALLEDRLRRYAARVLSKYTFAAMLLADPQNHPQIPDYNVLGRDETLLRLFVGAMAAAPAAIL